MKIFFAAMLCVLALVAVSCRNAFPSAQVLSGNMAHGQGQYQQAILHYLAAEDETVSALDVIFYNLGNVYYALGEGDAALRSWARAESSTGDVDTLFRIAFNRGLLYYNWGRYEEAYWSFRRALKLNPSDIDAKINLEESLSRIRTETSPATLPNETDSYSKGEETSRLLDYVRRKEVETWSFPENLDENKVQDW